MTWNKDQQYTPESKKIVWEVAPYLRGLGLDVGAGTFKVLPQAVSVDNGHHRMFGQTIKPDFLVKDAHSLGIFATRSMDYVYSSHLLEHLEDPKKALEEWWRVLKVKGMLVLYLPHDELYPKCGTEFANPDHKHDLNEEKVLGWMKEVAPAWDLIDCQKRDQDEEYSFLMVFKKLDGKKHELSYLKTKPEKTVLVCRFGAFGDLMQVSSVLAGLKQQGYHVTLMCSNPGAEVVKYDPHIDEFMILDVDQIPNPDLGNFWRWQSKKYTKFVNLSESVEGSMLAMPGRIVHDWSPMARERYMSMNYLELQHSIAGVPHKPQVKFYTTGEEQGWAKKQREKMGDGPAVLWSLAGSSVHKTWAGLDNMIAAIMVNYPTAHVILVGGPECHVLEAGWEKEPRVHLTCGKWSIRQSLSFISEADLIIGPETGVLNAACDMEVPKICFLSHSTWQNLTRDWKNTTALWSDNTTCKGRGDNEAQACHQLHYGWEHCSQDKESGTAQCQVDITLDEVWAAIEEKLECYKNGK
jgi:ADP-heptose:LPS heptosyltransferase/predicted SAM-dependent methyltransferase